MTVIESFWGNSDYLTVANMTPVLICSSMVSPFMVTNFNLPYSLTLKRIQVYRRLGSNLITSLGYKHNEVSQWVTWFLKFPSAYKSYVIGLYCSLSSV